MQTGRIFRKGPSWILSYRVKEYTNDGQLRWAQRSKKLAPINDEYRTAASVRHLAQDILGPQNAKTARPESTDTVAHFLKNVYLPNCKANLKPSTYVGYKSLVNRIEPLLGSKRLRDFDVIAAGKLLTEYGHMKDFSHNALRNLRGFLMGAFGHACRLGLAQFNPLRETLVPKGRAQVDTHAYDFAEVQRMLDVSPEPMRTVFLVAALTGLSRSELRGLKWTDITDDGLYVERGVVGSHIGETKTRARKAPVPLLPIVREALDDHRKTSASDFVFAGKTGKPLVLANVMRRTMQPIFEKEKIKWHGFHAFRRGVATNLNTLGVDDSVIQKILRHSTVTTTQAHYIKVPSGQAERAMKKLEAAFRRTAKKGQ